MSSRKGCSNPARAATSDPSYKGKSTADISGSGLDQLTHDVSEINLNSIKEDGWEVYGKKSKNKNGSNSSLKQSGPPHFGMQSHGGLDHTWSALASDSRKPAGRGHTKPQSSYGEFNRLLDKYSPNGSSHKKN